jgi:uncharacterized membrane protein
VIRDSAVNPGVWILLFAFFVVAVIVAFANWGESRYLSVAVGATLYTAVAVLLGIAALVRHWDGNRTVAFCVANAVIAGVVALVTYRWGDRG